MFDRKRTSVLPLPGVGLILLAGLSLGLLGGCGGGASKKQRQAAVSGLEKFLDAYREFKPQYDELTSQPGNGRTLLALLRETHDKLEEIDVETMPPEARYAFQEYIGRIATQRNNVDAALERLGRVPYMPSMVVDSRTLSYYVSIATEEHYMGKNLVELKQLADKFNVSTEGFNPVVPDPPDPSAF